MSSAIFLTNKIGCITFCNDIVSNLLNVNIDNIIDKPIAHLFIKSDTLINDTKNNKLYEFKNKPIDLQKSDGKSCHCIVSCTAIKDNQNSGYIITVDVASKLNDISSELNSKSELNNEKKLLYLLSENIKDGIAIVENGTVLFANKKFEEFWNVFINDAFSIDFLYHSIIANERNTELINAQIKKTGLFPETLNFWIKKKNDAQIFVSNRYTKVKTVDGKHLEILITTDITELKSAESHISEQRDRAQQYLDIAATPIVALDKDGYVILANKMICSILGREKKDVIGQNWFEKFIPERTRDSTRVFFDNLMKNDVSTIEYFEKPVVTSSGEERLIAWSNTLLTDKLHKIIGTLSSGEDITDRRWLEQELDHSRERVRLALDGSSLGTWDIDFTSGIVQLDKRAANILGFNNKSTITVKEICSIANLTDLRNSNSMLTGTSENIKFQFEAEYRINVKQDNVLWILEKGMIVERDLDGNVVRACGTILDITEKKQAKEISHILHEISECFSTCSNFNTGVKHTLESILKITGYNHGLINIFDEQSTLFKTIIYSDNIPEAYVEAIQAFKSKRLFSTTTQNPLYINQIFSFVNHNQTVFTPNSILMIPIIYEDKTFGDLCLIDDNNGDLNFNTITIVEELTAKVSEIIAHTINQSKLKWKGQLLDRMARSSPDGYYAVDNRNGDILYFNNRFCEIWNLMQLSEKMGKGEIMHEELRSFCVAQIVNANSFPRLGETPVGDNNDSSAESEMLFTDGRIIRKCFTQIRDDKNNYYGDFYRFEDITKRKQNEEELRKTKEIAEAASIEKSQFLATMSHEMRTPMNGIISMITLLMDSELSAENHRYAGIIQDSANNLLAILNNLLNYTKIEAKKVELENIDFEVRKLVSDMIFSLAAQAHQKGLELNYYVEPAVPLFLHGDPGRIRQILLNLAGNSIKFTAQGDIYINVSLIEENVQYYMLRFTIKDTGIGIPENMSQNLFTSFTQVDNTITRKYGGTGLGLVICKELVKLMDGDIGFESKPGDGTLFWFNIKSKKRSDNFWTTAITNERIPNFDGISILVVDDNENTRFILKEYLVKWGFRIQIECSAQSAVEAILNADENKNHYDIVLIDSMLPDIRLFIKNKQVKTIRMSGQTKIILMKYFGIKGVDDVTDNEYVEYDGFISKPVRSTALFECLQTIMRVEPNCLDLLHIDRKILHTMKVLVVEDNKINQKVAKVIFSKLGITCIIAEDGLKALDLMNIEQFDAIFMDCRLPFMDGFEVSRLIRNIGENNNTSVPIFLMTSDSEDDVIEKCQQFGINGYISKPVTPQSILTAIEKWTHKPGANLSIDNVVLPFSSKEIETKMAQKTILDTAKLYEKVGKDEDLIVLLFTTFITDCEKYMKEIRQSINESNIEKVKFNAHTIKGSALNLCAEDFSEAIIRLDYAAKCNDLEKSVLIMAECESRWIELKAYMEKQLSAF